MNQLVREFLQKFKRVRVLSEEKGASWEELSSEVIDLPKGWFELSRLKPLDRVGFLRDHWISFLPYQPQAHAGFLEFFSKLDDVAVVLYAEKEGEPLSPELLYSLGGSRSFFRGLPPADEEEIEELKRSFEVSLPHDYLSFLKIHNGFGKMATLGLFPSDCLVRMHKIVREIIFGADRPLQIGGKMIDPDALIPFYEEEGLFSFQCFYADWYPGSEMGNVYLSGIDYTISDMRDWKGWRENLAFPTFLQWLSEYVEGMSLSL
jgi:hypothetical protein